MGDVYYCRMTNLNAVTIQVESRRYELEKFQFKLDETKQATVFGSSGFFETSLMEVMQG